MDLHWHVPIDVNNPLMCSILLGLYRVLTRLSTSFDSTPPCYATPVSEATPMIRTLWPYPSATVWPHVGQAGGGGSMGHWGTAHQCWDTGADAF